MYVWNLVCGSHSTQVRALHRQVIMFFHRKTALENLVVPHCLSNSEDLSVAFHFTH